MAFRKSDGTIVVNRDAPVIGHYATHNPRREAINRAYGGQGLSLKPAPDVDHSKPHNMPLAAVDGRRPTKDPTNVAHVKLNCHAYVMGCDRRSGLVLPFLADQTHTLHIGTDYPLTPDVAPMAPVYAQGSPLLSNWRVYRGHQDICKRFLATKDKVCLIFEDDAVPNTADWPNVVNECIEKMGDLDILSLYGRQFKRNRFKEILRTDDGRSLLQLSDEHADKHARGGKHHVYGALAYLVNRRGARIISQLDWRGIPLDVEFWDETKFAFLETSPFTHDRSQGSLLFPASCPPRPRR